MWDPSLLGCGVDDTQETRFLAHILASGFRDFDGSERFWFSAGVA